MLEKLKRLWSFNVVAWVFTAGVCSMYGLPYDHDLVIAGLAHHVLPLVVLYIGLRFISKYMPVARPKPVIHVWSINGITAVCADADYRIACVSADRLRAATSMPKPHSLMIRPQPQLVAFFSSKEGIREHLSGKDSDYEALAEQCSIRRSELYIGPAHSRAIPVQLTTLYRLVFGNDDAQQAIDIACK